jgi:hypothetical protein
MQATLIRVSDSGLKAIVFRSNAKVQGDASSILYKAYFREVQHKFNATYFLDF